MAFWITETVDARGNTVMHIHTDEPLPEYKAEPTPGASWWCLKLVSYRTDYGRGPRRAFVKLGQRSVPVRAFLTEPVRALRYLCTGLPDQPEGA